MTRKTKDEVLEEFRCGSIQDAAMTVIARKGVGDATMQAIADEAGITKATIYAYFRDRDELLTRTAGRTYDGLVEELEKSLDPRATLDQQLNAVVRRQLEFFDENRELFRAYIALGQRGGSKPREGSYGRYIDLLERMFTAARDRDELRDIDPHEVAAVYADCVRGVVVRRIESKSKAPRDGQAAFIVSLLLNGIQPQSENQEKLP